MLDQLWFEDRLSADDALEQATGAADWQTFGEQISLPASVSQMSRRELADRFGFQFAQAMEELDPGEDWQGPVGSGFGWHIVRLSERDASQVPPFADIRSEVEDHWRKRTIAERKAQGYQILRDSYEVTIER